MKNRSLALIIATIIIAMSLKAQVTDTYTDPRDGKIYKTVKIGSQTWMAENLAYKESSGCWAYYNDISNVAKYGYLYNLETARTVCPEGWHLPGDEEWTMLTNYLGGEEFAGGKLKSTSVWMSPNTGATNSSGFSAIPGGYRSEDETFVYVGYNGSWWSSTEDVDGFAWFRDMGFDDGSVSRYNVDRTSGFSVRCVKD